MRRGTIQVGGLAILLALAGCTDAAGSNATASSVPAVNEIATIAPVTAAPVEPAPEPVASAASSASDDPTASGPSFDVAGYCREIGEVAGGSYMIEKTCAEQEMKAAAEL